LPTSLPGTPDEHVERSVSPGLGRHSSAPPVDATTPLRDSGVPSSDRLVRKPPLSVVGYGVPN